MTSQINPNNINANYPVPGVPNNTQGFRDNFSGTKNNFQYAADEISELQTKSVLKAGLGNSTPDNNMNDNLIYAVKLQDVSYTYLQNTATSGSITVDYSVGQYQQINPAAPVSLSFTNWPAAGSAAQVMVLFNITNVSQTVTLPATVNRGIDKMAGASPGTPGVSNTITFGATGYYAFQFMTTDGGTNIWIFDDVRPPDIFTSNVTIANSAVSTSKTTGALVVQGGVGIQGNLNVGGNLTAYTSTGNVSFQVLDTGFLQIKTPVVAANTAGAFSIQGSSTYQPLTNAGCMVHITGNDGSSSRIVNDAFGTGAIPTFSTRAARGTAAAPTAIQSGDVLARFGFTGWDGTDFGAPGGAGCAIEAVAIENFTDSAQGTNIKLYTSPATANTKTLSMTVASNVITIPGNVAVGGTGGIYITDSGTIGYNTGSGGTVSQTGNKSTGVTLNKPSGEITMQATALNSDTSVSFTLTNSTIAAKDVMILNIVGGATTPGTYNLDANCAAGSAVITVRNITAGSLSEALVLRYAVIKGSVS